MREIFDAKVAEFGDEMMDHLIKVIMLQVIDSQWKDHLLSIDHLKEGIGLRGYGQKDPKQEYKKEAYQLFMDMIIRIREEVVGKIFWVQISRGEEVEQIEEEQQRRRKQRLIFNQGVRARRPSRPRARRSGGTIRVRAGAGRNISNATASRARAPINAHLRRWLRRSLRCGVALLRLRSAPCRLASGHFSTLAAPGI